MKFCCPQAQPVRGLTDGQRASNGPRVDVVKLAATPWAPVLVALAIFEELAFAVPHCSRDGSVVSQCRSLDPAPADTAA